MSSPALIDELRDIRLAVRTHRDQIGDYRCWVDDQVLYHRVLPELSDVAPTLPNREDFHRQCELYHQNRQDPKETPRDIPLDSSVGPLALSYGADLDTDLLTLTPEEIGRQVRYWHKLIREHRDAGDARTFEHDRALYMNLPEKRQATTQLPPRELFLGRGCPAYNRFCQTNPDQFSKASWKT